MVNDPAGTGILHEMVPMKYAKLQLPSWKSGILKRIRAFPVAQIWDLLIAVFVILGMTAFLVVPILLSLMMPTGT